MILDDLLENRDEKYADFNARLIPTIERSKILGVRMPILRKITKSRYTELEDDFCLLLITGQFVMFCRQMY